MLYHFSEEPNIGVFSPRPSAAFPNLNPVVWAIDSEHAVNYYFPRDCPRVIYWKAPWSLEKDKNEFFSDTSADKIIVVENSWIERISQTTLYRYILPESSFEIFEEAKSAGYFISHQEIVPIRVDPINDLINNILNEKIELRFTPDLHPIKDRVISSSLDFSIIRFRNAKISDKKQRK